MKKIFALVAVAASLSANAMDLSVSHVRDLNLDKNGVRVEAFVPVFGMSPTVSATHVSNTYTRYGVGTQVNLTKVGPVSLGLTGSAVYQDSSKGANGYGLTVGAKGSVSLAKNVSLVAAVDRFVGQDRLRAFEGTQASVGLRVKF